MFEHLFKTREVRNGEVAKDLFENGTFVVGQSAPESQDVLTFDALGGTCGEMSGTEVWIHLQRVTTLLFASSGTTDVSFDLRRRG